MPSLPRSQCAHMMCKAPSVPHSRWCVDHGPATASTAPSRADNDVYKGAAWATIRARQLSSHPLCAGCQTRGIVQSANVADHVIPWRLLGRDYFRSIPLQSLCVECHSIKTGLESKGIYRVFGYRDLTIDDARAFAENGTLPIGAPSAP